MEFVLVTTTSTPDTSRSGSVMKFGDYREDEQKIEKLVLLPAQDDSMQTDSESDDEDKNYLTGFNVLNAQKRLISYEYCTKIQLSFDQRKTLNLDIGIHISAENPWKQIKKETLLDWLLDEKNRAPEILELRSKLHDLDEEEFVLVGLATAISKTEDSNTFLFYVGAETTNEAIGLIQRLESFERQLVNKTIYKYPRPWKCLGSEKEVDLQLIRNQKDKKEVEIQIRVNLEPKKHETHLHFRLAEDLRDSSVELVSKHKSCDNLVRRSVSFGVQSAAQKIGSEQQTDPTFPANAWTQYSYELPIQSDPHDFVESINPVPIDESNDISNEILRSSDAMKELLRVVEFNVIDIYRDDYERISAEAFKRYTRPIITELLSLSDSSQCTGRIVSALVWHPLIPEVLVVAFTYRSQVIFADQVFLWSFDDTLFPKFVLDAPREVTALSFCPYDANILCGGLVTGQVVIWHLGKLFQHPKISTDKQKANRNKIHSFITNPRLNENLPLTIGYYQLLYNSITSIRWMNSKHCIMANVHENSEDLVRNFATSSLNGTISFWNLPNLNDKNINQVRKPIAKGRTQEENVISCEKLKDASKPIYVVTSEKSISNWIFEEGQDRASYRSIVSTLSGSIHTFTFEGVLYTEGKPEKIKQIETFGAIHNGPVQVESNPFVSSIFLSVGQKVLAVWNGNEDLVPILWRRRRKNITCAQWSPSKMSLFFIALCDGSVEIWDLLTRNDDACISYDTGATKITVKTQQLLSTNNSLIFLISDHKANIRAFTISASILQTADDDVMGMIENVSKRKLKYSKWLQECDEFFSETKQFLQIEPRKTIESPTSQQLKDIQIRDEEGHKSLNTSKVSDLSCRLHKKWEKMMAQRKLKAMLVLKRIDPETIATNLKPEKDRLAYEADKRRSIEVHFQRVHHEISEIRARLLPLNYVDVESDKLYSIKENVDSIYSCKIDGFKYKLIEAELNQSNYNFN